MSRRKSIAEHRLAGTYQPSVHGRRAHEPQAPGWLIDDPLPEKLTPRQRALWRSVLKRAPRYTLCAADREIFAAYIVAVDVWEQARLAQSTSPLIIDGKPAPAIRILREQSIVMYRLADRLGFSPFARSGLGTAAPPADRLGDDPNIIRLVPAATRATSAPPIPGRRPAGSR